MYLRCSFLLFVLAFAMLCLQVHGKIYLKKLPSIYRERRSRPYGIGNRRGYVGPNPYFGGRAGNLVGNSAYGPSYAPQSTYVHRYGGPPAGGYQGYESGYGQQEQDFADGAPDDGQGGGPGGDDSNQGNYSPPGPGAGYGGAPGSYGNGPAGNGGGQSGYNQGPGGSYGNGQGGYGAQPGGYNYVPNYGSNNYGTPQVVPVGPGPVGIPAAQSVAQSNAQAVSTAPFGFPVFPPYYGAFPSQSFAQATANSFSRNGVVVPVPVPVALPAQSNANAIAQSSTQGLAGPGAPQVLPQAPDAAQVSPQGSDSDAAQGSPQGSDSDAAQGSPQGSDASQDLPQGPASSDDSDTRTKITGTGQSQAPPTTGNANSRRVSNGGAGAVDGKADNASGDSIGDILGVRKDIGKSDASNNIITF